MSAIENVQSYLPIVPGGNKLPKTTEVVFTVNRNYQAILPISVGNMESFLIAAGKYYAMELVSVLGVLKTINEDAIYPIISIIEPFMEATPDFDIPFPPKSSQNVMIKVTNRGRVTPTNFLDE